MHPGVGAHQQAEDLRGASGSGGEFKMIMKKAGCQLEMVAAMDIILADARTRTRKAGPRQGEIISADLRIEFEAGRVPVAVFPTVPVEGVHHYDALQMTDVTQF